MAEKANPAQTKPQTVSRRLLALAFSAVGLIAVLSACDELVTEVTEVTIAGHPTAEFAIDTGSVDSGCAPMTVRFVDKSNGPRDNWLWKFGDGDTSIDANPTHIYDSAGTYKVTLKISDTETEGVDTEIKKRFIIVGTSTSGFTFDTGQICPLDTVSFIPELGGASSWTWDFGDGSVLSTDTFPKYTYNSAGVYGVKFTVTGDCGVDSVIDSITIANCPRAIFVIDSPFVAAGCGSLTVNFSDSSTVDAPEDIALRSWDFGDGNTLDTTAFVVSHIYDSAGTFTVSLTVESTDGSTDIASKVDAVTLHDSLIASFTTLNSPNACESPFQQFQVKFLDNSSGDIVRRYWSFGDGTHDSTNNPSPLHAYTETNRYYDVELITQSTCGETDTSAIDSFVSFAGPLSSIPFTMSFDTVVNVDTVDSVFIFEDVSNQVITNWSWDFGDGSVTDTGHLVGHFYTAPGTYEVTLTATDGCGGGITLRDTAIVVPPPGP